jgi:hypothetical protein
VLTDLPDAPGGNTQQPTHRPLAEVAEAIRAELAAPAARKKMDEALSTMRGHMKNYTSQYIAWRMSPEANTTSPPASPDLRALAQPLGLTANSTPLVDILQIQESDPITDKPLYDIIRSYDQSGRFFVQFAFAPELRAYEVQSIMGFVRDTEYLYWKTGEQAERVPTLDEVRDAVVRSLKMKQALELAKADAQQVVEQLKKSGQRPSDMFRNDANRRVLSVDSVTWMSPSPLPNQPPRTSPIPGIPYPGEAFFRTVFALDANETAVAVDNPQDTAYAVFVTRVETDAKQLQQQFLTSGPTPETDYLALVDNQMALLNWIEKFEKDLGVHWQRDPRPDSSSR